MAVYHKGRQCEFFDSYAEPLSRYKPPLTAFVNRHGGLGATLRRPLQSDETSVCGHYCIFYLSSRVRGGSLRDVAREFPGPLRVNDRKVCHRHQSSSLTAISRISILSGVRLSYG